MGGLEVLSYWIEEFLSNLIAVVMVGDEPAEFVTVCE